MHIEEMIPFSNGTDYMIWQNRNCSFCINYECESPNREEAICKLAFDLDYALMDSGKISLETAKRIGYLEDNGRLKFYCNQKNKAMPIFKPLKLYFETLKQFRIF